MLFFSLNLLPYRWFISPGLKLDSSWASLAWKTFQHLEGLRTDRLHRTLWCAFTSPVCHLSMPHLLSSSLHTQLPPFASPYVPGRRNALGICPERRPISYFSRGVPGFVRCIPGSWRRVMSILTCHLRSPPRGCSEAPTPPTPRGHLR